jgi:hypothetical protein
LIRPLDNPSLGRCGPSAIATFNILLFFDIQKNGTEMFLVSQMKTKYGFDFKSIFQALKWVFVFPKGRESTK